MAKIMAVDSSVVVKWFKKGEDSEEEALKLRRDIFSSTLRALASELVQLEVCRALMKVGYRSERVVEAYATLGEMDELGFLEFVSTRTLKDEAKGMMVDLKLYVSDALSLATSVANSLDLLTEDRHLLKAEVREFLEGRGLRVLRLEEAYGKSPKLKDR